MGNNAAKERREPGRLSKPARASGYKPSMPWKHAVRDLVLIAVTLVLWRADAAVRGEAGVWPVLIAVATGALTTFVGYLAHEWGHFAGARAGGSIVRVPASAREIFLFNFDSDRNSREQFLLMSSGGFLASALVIALFLAVLPLPPLGMPRDGRRPAK